MALTFAKVSREDLGLAELLVLGVTLDNAYVAGPNGGYDMIAGSMPFRVGERLDQVTFAPLGGRKFEFVPHATRADRGKLKVLGSPGDDFLLNRPGVAIGTVSAAEVKITNPITYSVAGVLAELAAAEHAFTATTDDITADAAKIQEALYLLSVTGGTVTITKGTTADEDEAVLPSLPAGEAPVGVVKIQVAAGAVDFDATSDDLDAAHLTATFHDWDNEAADGADLSALTVRATALGR